MPISLTLRKFLLASLFRFTYNEERDAEVEGLIGRIGACLGGRSRPGGFNLNHAIIHVI